MSKLDDLMKQLDAAQGEYDQEVARVKKLGDLYVSVEEYHDLTCKSDYFNNGCNWKYENDDDFKVPGSAHHNYVVKYETVKERAESALDMKLEHSQFIDLTEAFFTRVP